MDTENKITRRKFLKIGAVVAGTSLAGGLTACHYFREDGMVTNLDDTQIGKDSYFKTNILVKALYSGVNNIDNIHVYLSEGNNREVEVPYDVNHSWGHSEDVGKFRIFRIDVQDLGDDINDWPENKPNEYYNLRIEADISFEDGRKFQDEVESIFRVIPGHHSYGIKSEF
jgi:hypothetical protein